LTLIWLIPVIKPTSLELRPSAFSKMTYQRLRKQWLPPFLRPSSNIGRSLRIVVVYLLGSWPQRYEII
jgi:hypothetical protein